MLKKRNLTSFVLSIVFLTVSGFASETVLLYFYGENPQVPTAPHTQNLIRQVVPLLEELAQQGHPIRGVDAYQNVDFALQWNIKELPTFIMVVNGQTVDRINGIDEPARMKPRLMQMLGAVQNSVAQPSASPNPLPQLPVHAAPVQPTQIRQVGAVMSQRELSSQYDNPFIKATVRLRIDGSDSHDWGTGTIIDAGNGHATILTCGHIFRDSQGRGRIEVNLFSENSEKKLHGKLIQYDVERDIAFVSITPNFPVTAVPLAPRDFALHDGETVISTGCDGGAEPTLKHHRILSSNTVFSQTMPAFYYVQVDNPPVQGRSGGGLFSKEGYLVGVCSVADGEAGFFIPLSTVRYEMGKQPQLAVIDQNSGFSPLTAEPVPLIANPVASLANAPKPLQNNTSETLSPEEQATLDQIRRYQQDGAKIVCVIYSERNPNQSIDVIQLQSASPQFLNALREQTPTGSSNSLNSATSNTSNVIAPSTLHNGNTRIPTAFPVMH